jgi:hypothetical protein
MIHGGVNGLRDGYRVSVSVRVLNGFPRPLADMTR